MKHIKNTFRTLFILLFVISCDDDRDLDFIDSILAPSEVAATFDVSQDNTGTVTITPKAIGANSFTVTLGDGSSNETISNGESIEHTYAEGTYEVTVVASNIKGDTAEVKLPLAVSFSAPSNVVATIENDAAVSRKVNITVTGDDAITYDFYSGETGSTDPVASGNIGETVSYTYTTPGTYSVRVVIKGAAIQTTEYTEDFEVTEILQPIASAPNQPARASADVISIFSSEYTNVAGVDTFPDWGQTGNFGSTWGTFTLGTDDMLQYTNISYQGIVFNSDQDVSNMEFLHLDVWTADVGKLKTFLINNTAGGATEASVEIDLTVDAWTSIDIPISDFTAQGLTVSQIFQMKFEGEQPWPDGTVFIDNLYFYKAPSGASPPLISDDFEGNGNVPSWLGDGAGANTTFANPYNNADNLSETVLEYTDTGGQFANVQFTASSKLDLSNGKSVFSIKVYVPSSSISGSQPNQVSLKLQNSALGGNAWQTQTEIVKPIVLDQWQTITFDFVTDNWVNLNNNGVDPDPVDRTDLDKVVIQLNSENNNDTVTGYIDDFYYGFAQVQETPPIVKDGFEGRGTIPTWVGDGAGANASFANPFIDTDNNSPTVLEYTDTGGQFANVNFTVANKFNIADKNTFSIKIYVPSSSISGSQLNQVSLKLQNSALGGNAWQTQTEVIKTIVLDQWQTITFDFVNDNWVNLNNNGTDPDPINRTDLDKVVIQVNSENNNDTVTAYIDNVNYYKK